MAEFQSTQSKLKQRVTKLEKKHENDGQSNISGLLRDVDNIISDDLKDKQPRTSRSKSVSLNIES